MTPNSNDKPSLVLELETARILQTLSQTSSFTAQPTMPSATATRTSAPTRKRKFCESILLPPFSLASHSTRELTGMVLGSRAVSPSLSSSSTSSTSPFPPLLSTEATPFQGKPLDAPPKLRRVSFNSSPAHSNTRHKKHVLQSRQQIPQQQNPSEQHLVSPVVPRLLLQTRTPSRNSISAQQKDIVPPMAPIFDTNMLLKVLTNPMVRGGNMVPMCYPTGSLDMSATILPMMITQGNQQGQQSKNYSSGPLPLQVNPASRNARSNHPVSQASPVIKNASTASSNKAKKRKLCRMEGCSEEAARRTPYCKNHAGPRKCEAPGCKKCAQGRTRFCIGHGGGRRCQFEGCTKGARDKQFCASHGGGRRCNVDLCTKLAVGKGFTCTAHGGGRRCQHENCSKSAQSSSDFCVRHGGGRICRVTNCPKVARGKLGLCMSHTSREGNESSGPR